jgi:hypothetical protein
VVSSGSPGPVGPGLTIRRGGRRPEESAAPARRLTLTGAEWAVLVDGRLTDPPPQFAVAHDTGAGWDEAVGSLIARGILLPPDGAGPAAPVPAVAGNLEVLRRPVLSVRLDVTGRAGARHGWFAVGSGFVAGVLTLPGGGVELSLAPDVRLGAELARAVPEAAAVTGPGFPDEPAATGVVPEGRLPLGLLDDVAWPPDGGSAPSPDETALAEELLGRTGGSLSCLVLGRAGNGVGAGQVAWLATDRGWLGLRPRPDASPRRLVDAVPVQPADLGGWVSPSVAALLEASDELA